MPARLLAPLLVLLAAACGKSASPTAPAAKPDAVAGRGHDEPPPLEAEPGSKKGAGRILFRWSDGKQICRVPARQDVEKKGSKAALTFTGVLQRLPDGWTFDMEQMTLVETEGRAPTEAERKQVAALSTIPTTVLDDDGAFVEMRGMNELVDRMVASGQIPPEVAQRMKSPEIQAVMAQSAGTTWNTFLGAVLGVTLGEDFTVEKQVPMGGGTVPATVTFADHGKVRGRPDLELLTVTQVMTIDTSSPAFGGLLTAIGAPPGEVPDMGSIRAESTVTVAIEPVSGRSYRARMEKVVALGDRTQREVRDTTFDWAKATGCGP